MLVAVITVSDTCYNDSTLDKSGPSIVDFIKENYTDAEIMTSLIPDEIDKIEMELKRFSDIDHVDLIITTGGTGLSSRDVTPEATKAVIHKEIPAIPLAITLESLKVTPMAMLSRAIAGIRNKTLIINLPGSKKAVSECIKVVKPVLLHAIALIKDKMSEVKSVHSAMDHKCTIHSIPDLTRVAYRDRNSPFPMIDVNIALSIVDEVMKLYNATEEKTQIEDCLGKIVSKTVYANEPMPPFPASIKDGYACISSDGIGKRYVRAALIAGDQNNIPLAPGECIRINTGAAVPSGADCVVQVEDTKLIAASDDGKIEYEIEVMKAPQPNQDIRPVGFDMQKGAVLVDKFTLLDAAHIGLLAGAGFQCVDTISPPKVALLSTGNELQEPWEEHLKPSHIRDSNRIMLKLLLKDNNFESIDCGIVGDDPKKLYDAIYSALKKADILVCTGGVSMGEKDLLKPVLIQNFRAKVLFGRVNMKPGKPATFATLELDGETKYVFALPGNPVSAYVCALLFVVRALRRSTGRDGAWPRMRVQLAREKYLDARPEYARAVIRFGRDDVPTAELLGNQCSSRLASACGTSVLLELPPASPDHQMLPAGSVVTALLTGRIQAS